MQIVIDTREQSRLVSPIFDEMLMQDRWKDVKVERHVLEYGDYLLRNGPYELIIERKSIPDFINSYAKGHLKDKLFILRQRFQRTMLLIEGVPMYRDDEIIIPIGHGRVVGLDRTTMLRFLMNQEDKGTWIWHTKNLEDTIYQLFLMVENLGKIGAPQPSLKCGKPGELLLQLPGLGAKKLEDLQREYSSPMAALADIDSWATPTIKKVLKSW